MESWQDQVAAAHAEVINDIKSKFAQLNGGPSVIEGVKAFCAAVDWNERWIIALLVVQALVFTAAILLRKRTTTQAVIFFSAMALVYNAERINTFAGRHWESFSGQNYFQAHGLFTSALLSAPLLVTMVVILINYLIEMGLLMVEMKRKELIYKARQQQRQQGATEDTKKTK